MISRLHVSDLPCALDFCRRQRTAPDGDKPRQDPADALLARYQALYQGRRCVHVVYRTENRISALAGVVFTDDAAFLSTKVCRYAQIVDEFVAPDCAEPDVRTLLRTALLGIIAENHAILISEPPANKARLEAFSAGNFRL